MQSADYQVKPGSVGDGLIWKGPGNSSNHKWRQFKQTSEDVAILQIRSNPVQPLEVKVTFGGKPLWMELAKRSLIFRMTF